VSLAATTTRNAVANTLGALWGTLLAFIATSVIIRAFGADLYGVYVLIAAAAGYISLVELNLSSALVKYVAEHTARGETQQVEEVIGTTIFLYILLSVAAAAAFLLAGRALLPLLHVPAAYLETAWRLWSSARWRCRLRSCRTRWGCSPPPWAASTSPCAPMP
jgi:O-antigen/teichoic acid export membrane protein